MVTLLVLSLTRPARGGHYKPPNTKQSRSKDCVHSSQLVRAPRGHDLIQLTGDNFHLIPAPNYFVIVTQRSSFQHHDSCPRPVTVVISSPPEYFFRHGLVWFSKES